jgi:hypothetical protein
MRSSTFKLKPHRAVPLPLDTSGAFTIVPKALKEDKVELIKNFIKKIVKKIFKIILCSSYHNLLLFKVFLFGEIMIEDEYNPTAPTEYGTYKAKR